MKKLTKFGKGSYSEEAGYDLGLVIGHLEGLVEEEGDHIRNFHTRRAKRLRMVEDALQLLNDAYEMGNETEEL